MIGFNREITQSMVLQANAHPNFWIHLAYSHVLSQPVNSWIGQIWLVGNSQEAGRIAFTGYRDDNINYWVSLREPHLYTSHKSPELSWLLDKVDNQCS